jgi:hypothetical protein
VETQGDKTEKSIKDTAKVISDVGINPNHLPKKLMIYLKVFQLLEMKQRPHRGKWVS